MVWRENKVNELSYPSTGTLVSLLSMGSLAIYLHKECAVVGVLGEVPRLHAHLEEAESIEPLKTRASRTRLAVVRVSHGKTAWFTHRSSC
jgi:hypothetical protein